MPSSRRTSLCTTGDAPQRRTLPSQKSIHEFGRVAKPQSPAVSSLKRKAIEEVIPPAQDLHCRNNKQREGRHASCFEPELAEAPTSLPVKRRKLAVENVDKPGVARAKAVRHASACKSGRVEETGALAIKKRKLAAEYLEELEVPPASATPTSGREPFTPRHKRPRLDCPVETPTKGTSTLLDALTLKPYPNVSQSTSSCSPFEDTPPTSPASIGDCGDVPLPFPLQQLIRLHSSFLAALSLHYAHNGSSISVDLGPLLLLISNIWGKPGVDVDDLRRILGIINGNGHRMMQKISTSAGHGFSLSDYGPGRLCLDIKEPDGQSSGGIMRLIDEDRLNSVFEQKLRCAWTHWQSASKGLVECQQDDQAFVKQLPLAPITVHVSLQMIKPIFAKGQKRLEELKARPLKPQAPHSLVMPVDPPQKSSNRSLALIERIRAKQLHASSAPNGPSKVELDRKAALHRLDSIVAVLTLVATGTGRKAFSMQMLVQQVQGSLRNPMSREEVERCLRLLAEEVAPGYVSLVKTGQVTGVVIDPGRRIGMGELAGRVAAAVGVAS